MVVDFGDGGQAVTSFGLERRVREQLQDVLDPCSCFTDEPVNIVALGLVEDITVNEHTARIELLLTSPGCSYLPYIENDIERRVGAIAGIETVEIQEVTDQIWTRERMNSEVREARRDRFRTRMEAAGVTPYAQNVD